MTFIGKALPVQSLKNRTSRRAKVVVATVIALVGLSAAPALGSVALGALVTDQASAGAGATPMVPGGQCYPGVADPSACRRVLSMIKVGNWIYVAGIISDVYDNTTKQTITGFHNLFRFDATTHAVDQSWKPQAYRTVDTYRDASVTGLAASADGSTIYAAGAFLNVADGPGQPGIVRKGVAAFSATTGAVVQGFNAKVGAGGGPVLVNDVKLVGGDSLHPNGTLWLGGSFTHLGKNKTVRSSLASVDPVTGALTTNIGDLGISGKVTTTAPTKIHKLAINQQQTEAAVIGNFTTVGGATHKEVVILDIDTTDGGVSSVSAWNAPHYLEPSQTKCNQKDTWARGVDWSPDGSSFDIVASGGGGFNAYPGLCDAFTRFNFNPSAPDFTDDTPALVNFTGFDSLFATCDTGTYAYLGGHNKNLNQALYIKALGTGFDGRMKKVGTGGPQAHYGIGVINVDPATTDKVTVGTKQVSAYGFAVPMWNSVAEATGRGAGWASCLAVDGDPLVGGGVYVGGDGVGVNGDNSVRRLAYFPSPATAPTP